MSRPSPHDARRQRETRKEGRIIMANSSGTAPLYGGRMLVGRAPAAGVAPAMEQDIVRFALQPNPKFERCLAQYPNDLSRRPSVRVAIVRGSLDDELFLVGRYIK